MSDILFERVSPARIRDMLFNLNAFTGLNARLLNGQGEERLTATGAETLCAASASCTALYQKAGVRALGLGESYIFACPRGGNYIASPLTDDGALLGTILLGPFLMEEAEAGTAETNWPVLAPGRVTALSRLMNYMLQSIIPAERAILLRANETLQGQSRINEAIQMYKNQALSNTYDYFYQQERELMSEVKTGDVERVKAMINDLLGYVLFSEGWNLTSARLRAIELTTLLSRVALEGGAQTDAVFTLNERFLSLISQHEDIESLSMLLLDVVEGFMDAMFSGIDKGNLHIRKALKYIAGHYAEPLRVSDVAEALGLSSDYFAALFRSTVGEPFSAYLMRIRVERARQLLLSTDSPLTDIALATGFSDQSYFCRVFKRLTGLSPGRYRK